MTVAVLASLFDREKALIRTGRQAEEDEMEARQHMMQCYMPVDRLNSTSWRARQGYSLMASGW